MKKMKKTKSENIHKKQTLGNKHSSITGDVYFQAVDSLIDYCIFINY